MAKKKQLTLEEKLEEAIVKDGPYEVPGNWVWTKLNFISNLVTGNTPSKSNLEFYGHDVLFIKPNDLDQGRRLKYSNEMLSNLGAEKARILPKGSIAVCCIGSIGKASFLEVEGATNQQINSIIPININNLYIYYYVLSEYFQKELLNNSSATTISIINKSKMSELKAPIPPLKEQQRIVDKIESLFEKLDKSKELIEEAREGFEKRKSSVLENAFRGELTEKWREENNLGVNSYESVKDEINKRKELYCKVKKKDMPNFMNYSISDITIDSSLPSTWIKCPIGLLCGCIVPGRDKPKSFTGLIPWITIPNLISNTINRDSSELKLSDNEISEVNGKKIPIGSVVMSCVGRFGISAIVEDECVINQQLHAFLPSKLIDKKYLMYHIKISQNYLESIATSTTIAYINKSGCNSLPINLAPLEEQKEIVKILDKLLEEESKIEELTQLEDQIELIKKSILAKAFRGELGTNSEEDESALELLKEILSKDI